CQRLISEKSYLSQEEIRRDLQNEGFEGISQSTVSRLLKLLGACYTGISSAVGNGKLMTIAVTAGQRHLWNGLTAGRQRTTGFQK
ncbi:hypothetical protein MJM43_31820, partial [Salmonella enterica subsp. enterica serovar Montevideo]|nr:hypothetical protein [Salmonella enterica subsp. enterica serovar Montevideo]